MKVGNLDTNVIMSSKFGKIKLCSLQSPGRHLSFIDIVFRCKENSTPARIGLMNPKNANMKNKNDGSNSVRNYFPCNNVQFFSSNFQKFFKDKRNLISCEISRKHLFHQK